MDLNLQEKLKLKIKLEQEIAEYPRGYLHIHNAGFSSEHYMLTYTCSKKSISRYVRKADVPTIKKQIEEREEKRVELSMLKKEILRIEKRLAMQETVADKLRVRKDITEIPQNNKGNSPKNGTPRI